MPIDTKHAERRTLRFATLDDALADARRLASGAIRVTGNRTPEDLFGHLAKAIDADLDGLDRDALPWSLRLLRPIGPLLRYPAVHWPMPAGFRLPTTMEPQFLVARPGSLAEELQRFAAAVDRANSQSEPIRHAVFGRMTPEQVRQHHCRHAELHLSFLHRDAESRTE